eukprot:344332-Rhodomonas_salina.2
MWPGLPGSVGALSKAVEGLALETKEIRAHVGMVEGQVSGALSPPGRSALACAHGWTLAVLRQSTMWRFGCVWCSRE